jgi:hypothetical protein
MARRCPARNAASDHELVEIFRAFDLTITYDKLGQRLHLAATITPVLLPDSPNDCDRPEGRSQINDIAGERFAPMGDLSALVERVVPWP